MSLLNEALKLLPTRFMLVSHVNMVYYDFTLIILCYVFKVITFFSFVF